MLIRVSDVFPEGVLVEVQEEAGEEANDEGDDVLADAVALNNNEGDKNQDSPHYLVSPRVARWAISWLFAIRILGLMNKGNNICTWVYCWNPGWAVDFRFGWGANVRYVSFLADPDVTWKTAPKAAEAEYHALLQKATMRPPSRQ